MPLSGGTRLGQYEILEQIGAGGMGEVYRAKDTRLKRDVALKVLPEALANAPALMLRFQREAEVLASLNHPHIATLFGLSESNGKRALVMELVEGPTLPSPLPLAKALNYAGQIAEALEYAHEKGVIHRDLKPSNIKVTPNGSVKVLDFGLAKAINDPVDPIDSTKMTTLGASRGGDILGTAAYMPPEQANGRPADRRSDIWSYGAVLYEMLTGKQAFVGESVSDTIASVLREDPDWGALPASTPESIQRLIKRCLTKDRNQRLQAIGEARIAVEEALAALKSASALPQKAQAPVHRRRWFVLAGEATAGLAMVATVAVAFWKFGGKSSNPQGSASIAVLPFEDLSPTKDQEFFSKGLAEDLLNGLSKIQGLQVAGSASSFQFKDRAEDYRAIGEKLNVATILAGSVRNNGDQTRIAAKLIKAADGFLMWSEIFDRRMNDVFAVQQDIAFAVARELKVKLLGERAAAKSTRPDAYKAFLQGRYFMEQDNKESLEKAVAYFDQAIALDRNYAPAWVGLGQTRSSQAAYFYIPSEEGYRQARAAVERALVVERDQADAYATLGWIMMLHDWDWAGADASYHRALSLEPKNVRAISGGAAMAMLQGRSDESISLNRRAIGINPLSAGDYHNLGVALHYAGRQDEAKAALQKALEINPAITFTHSVLGRVYLAQSKPAEALAEMQQEKETYFRLFGLTLAYHALGRKKESDQNLAELIDKFRNEDPCQIAVAYAFRGEPDRAFEWLDRALAARDSGLAELKADPILNSLKHDTRYRALLDKIGLAR